MDRKWYYKKIWKYVEKRKEIKKRYKHGDPRYKVRIKAIKMKIDTWRCQIKRIDARKEKISQILRAVNRYFVTDIRKKKYDKTRLMAVNVFYKYAMENGIEGAFLARHMNRKDVSIPSRLRLKFTRSFKDKPTHKEVYHNFKKFMNDTGVK